MEIRIRAAFALEKMGPAGKPALPALIEAASDNGNLGPILYPDISSSVKQAAIQAALKIDPASAASLCKTAMPGLLEDLKSEDTGVRQGAVYALEALGPRASPAIPALVEVAKKRRGFDQSGAFWTLQKIGPEGVAALTSLIKDRDLDLLTIRLQALHAFDFVKEPSQADLQALTEALKDQDPEIQVGAADRLGRFGPKARAAIPDLIAVMKPSESTRTGPKAGIYPGSSAALALGRIGAEAVPALVKALQAQAAACAFMLPRPWGTWAMMPGQPSRTWKRPCPTKTRQFSWKRQAPWSWPEGERKSP